MGPCQLKPIARSTVCEIWICTDCGTVHVNCGIIRFRLEPCQFRALAASFAEAAAALRDGAPVAARAANARH